MAEIENTELPEYTISYTTRKSFVDILRERWWQFFNPINENWRQQPKRTRKQASTGLSSLGLEQNSVETQPRRR